jgi:hypothetical protein
MPPFNSFFGAVDEVLSVEKFIINSKIERVLQIVKFVLNLKKDVINIDAKSTIGDIFNKYKDERGIELTNNLKKYTDFRMVID